MNMSPENNSIQAYRLLVVAFILFIAGAVVVGAASPADSSSDQAPPINDSTSATGATDPASVTSPQQYTITATSIAAMNQSELRRYGTVGTQADRRVELTMPPSNVSAVEELPWVTDVRPALHPAPSNIPGGSDGESLGVERLHEQGVTGGGIKVGIIDNGFEESAIDGTIQASVSFRNTPGDPAHGTGVAEVVTRTAPDTQLYLASAETGVDHQKAIEYLVDQNVDIIVYSISWPPIAPDGNHFLTESISSARQQGTLFITSAGNYAETHWEGEFRDADDDARLEWDRSGDEQNALPAQDANFDGGRLNVYIRWKETGAPSNYRAALYNPDTEQYVAVGDGERTNTGSNRFTRLGTSVRSQPLALVVENTAGPADDEVEIVVTDGPSKIEQNIPSSSLGAPADVPAAVTVGAYQRGAYAQQSGIASYSSRGPTEDGRIGIDVTGYTNIGINNRFYEAFTGTSAAAPHVGGVAALVEAQHKGEASPTEVETVLESTTDDIQRPGEDTISGAGVVNAGDAVGSLTTPTPTSTPTPTPGESARTIPDLNITAQPSERVGTNTTFDIAYRITNTGDAPGAFTVTVPQSSANLSVERFAGDIQGPNSDGTPPSTPTTSADPGQNVSITVTYRVAQNATGTGNITVEVTSALSEATDSATTAVELGEPPIPSTPRGRALQIAAVENPANITQTDITIAITRRDRGQAANGVEVTQSDITTLITLRDRTR
jgi:subtilisin family serine protease